MDHDGREWQKKNHVAARPAMTEATEKKMQTKSEPLPLVAPLFERPVGAKLLVVALGDFHSLKIKLAPVSASA
jgi:hypothetical protein